MLEGGVEIVDEAHWDSGGRVFCCLDDSGERLVGIINLWPSAAPECPSGSIPASPWEGARCPARVARRVHAARDCCINHLSPSGPINACLSTTPTPFK